MHSRVAPKKQAQKKVVKTQSKRTKTVKTAKKQVKPITNASHFISTTSKSTTPTFLTLTTPPALNRTLFSSKRSFRSTTRSFAEPEATGPAAAEDISPEVQKIIQEILKLNIMQTLQLTKSLKKEFGYNDSAFAMAAPVAVAAAGTGAAAAEEEKPKAVAKTSFNIKLESFDAGSKVKVIKEVRTITGLGLKEAKDLVDGAPQILKKEVKKEEAEAIVKLMKETGAVCILE